MSFYSLQFVVFLVALLACYYAVGRFAKRGQWIVLLVGSLAFYLTTGWQNLFFILLTSVSTWIVGLAFARIDGQCDEARKAAADRKEKKAIKARFKHRKWLVLLAVMILNFGVLGYIKYWNTLLAGFGADNTFLASQLLLPLGISFYTFQSVSYVVDAYNGRFEPQRNFLKHLLFVSWFPQVIQGPINRFDDMATQLYERHSFDLETTRRALLLIGFGLLKKYVMADTLVTTISTALDNMGVNTPGSVVVYGILLYTIQQYGDFSGGIDMVRGISELFGIRMAENFKQPYFSTSLSNFWQRWHMTLGAWMRDYVFYPFTFHRNTKKLRKWLVPHVGRHLGAAIPAALGNLIVFFLVGLWHGAEAHYIAWGLYNGIVIALADLLLPVFTKLNGRLKVNMAGAPHRVFCIVRTFIVINIGWYFDRIYDMGDCLLAFRNTLFSFDAGGFLSALGQVAPDNYQACLLLAAVGCVVVFAVSVLRERGVDVVARVLRLPYPVQLLIYVSAMVLIVVAFMFGPVDEGFMYANF